MLDLLPTKKFMLKVSNRNSRKKCKIFLRFTIKTPATLLKKRLWHRCFSVKCFKNTIFYRTLSVGAFLPMRGCFCQFLSQHLKASLRTTTKEIKQGAKFLKASIHCEIFISDYFMEHSLMYNSLHLIWFHETHIKYVKRKAPRNMIGKK